MMFSTMLMNAFQDSDTGFPIRYRFDGNIFNLRMLNYEELNGDLLVTAFLFWGLQCVAISIDGK